jgi:hypothetical protein
MKNVMISKKDHDFDRGQKRSSLGELKIMAFFLALAGLVFYEANTSLVKAEAASGGAMFNAALYPKILAWVLVLFSSVRLFNISRLYSHSSQTLISSAKKNYTLNSTVFLSTCLLLIYILALKPLGYHLTTPFFMFAFFLVLGTKNVYIAAAIAFTTWLTLSFIFEYLLGVILPVGIFGIGF